MEVRNDILAIPTEDPLHEILYQFLVIRVLGGDDIGRVEQLFVFVAALVDLQLVCKILVRVTEPQVRSTIGDRVFSELDRGSQRLDRVVYVLVVLFGVGDGPRDLLQSAD